MASQSSGATAQATIRIAHFRHKRDVVPREHDTTWDELGELLTHHAIRTLKDGPLWSPVSYKPDTTRANANVEMVFALVQDFDHGVHPDDVLPGCARFAYIAHSTHRNAPDDPRWRIVFPLARPIPVAEWPAVWKKMTAHFGGNTADPACKEPARMYYKPSHPEGSPYWALIHEGEAVDPDEWPDVEEPKSETNGSRNGKHESAPVGKGDYRTLDVVAMFKSHSHYGRDMGGGKHAVLCPWYLGHSDADKAEAGDSDTVVWEASGKVWPQFDCKHAHCVGRGISDVITFWDGDSFCEREYVPLTINLDRGESTPNGKEPGEATESHEKLWTDIGNAERLRDDHGRDIRYCGAWKGWLVWDGQRWRKDSAYAVETLAHDTVKGLYQQAWAVGDKKMSAFAIKSQSSRAIQAMVSRAHALDPLKSVASQYDTHPWLLNVANGTIDLETGELRNHSRADYITHLVPLHYDPRLACPRFERFMLEIMAGRKEYVACLQQMIGYSLTGSTREQKLFILFGEGSNGKSCLLDVIHWLAGEYGHKMRRELIMSSRQPNKGAASPEIAILRGKRFVYVSETAEDGHLDEAFVKEITGDSAITARGLWEGEVTFQPEFTPWLGTNHKPVINENNDAIWRRLPLIPFEVKFVNKPASVLDPNNLFERVLDFDLLDTLRSEVNGILAWAVKGAVDYYRAGSLVFPPGVIAASNEYRAESDKVQAFIDDCLKSQPAAEGIQARKSRVHERYREWAKLNNAPAYTDKSLSRLLREKGFKDGRAVSGHNVWLDVEVLGGPVTMEF